MQLLRARREALACLRVLAVGQSNCAIDARSTVPPSASIVVAASSARRVFSEASRNDAENTRKRTSLRFEAPLSIA